MRTLLSDLFYFCFDVLVPPRGSDAVVRSLTLDDLYALGNMRGELRYRDARVRALVWELKYRGSSAAARLCGQFLSEQLLALSAEVVGTPLLVPVPMHPSRRAIRGHNQTELLCEAALPHLGGAFEYAPKALERVRSTPAQRGLMRGRRLRNVKNSMRACPELVEGRACVVVDDVSTTGATLAEARRALLAAGAREVHTVSLAATE
jgi:ComF family protein